MKPHTAAAALTTLTLAGGALAVGAIGVAPAYAASCATVTVSSSGPLTALVLSVSSVTVTQGGCVTFHNSTSETASITVDGSSVASLPSGGSGGDYSASSAGGHAVAATVSGLLHLPKPGAGLITVTPKSTPKPKVPVPTPKPPKTGGGGGSGSAGHSSGGGITSGSGGGGSAGTGHSSSHGSAGHKHSSAKGKHHRSSTGPGLLTGGGLLSSGADSGFSLPSVGLGTFSQDGLASVSNGTAPQLAPQVGASTDAAGNPLPLVNGSGTQHMALAGDSSSSGNRSTIPSIVAALLVLATGAGLLRTRHLGAVDDDHAPAHRA